MGNVLIFLKDHPQESRLIGEILIAYGELENSLVDLVCAVQDEDSDTVLRALFRLRSEGQRLDVADAIARKWINQQGLGGVYALALGAIRRCKAIRNQYAHCAWYEKNGLCFINLEEAAKKADDPLMLTPRRVNLPLLQRQREFFDYTESLLIHVADSYRKKLGMAVQDRGNGPPDPLDLPELFLS